MLKDFLEIFLMDKHTRLESSKKKLLYPKLFWLGFLNHQQYEFFVREELRNGNSSRFGRMS